MGIEKSLGEKEDPVDLSQMAHIFEWFFSDVFPKKKLIVIASG